MALADPLLAQAQFADQRFHDIGGRPLRRIGGVRPVVPDVLVGTGPLDQRESDRSALQLESGQAELRRGGADDNYDKLVLIFVEWATFLILPAIWVFGVQRMESFYQQNPHAFVVAYIGRLVRRRL
ncbi:hypothetical protein [Pistricoccus aurantiacus]|uniref:hypothetical protein n=1 Tax=Pistricoccus aurantiacus TaxID=1883414 RepID=UPI003642FEF3